MAYRAPVAETVFFLDNCTSLGRLAGKGALAELSTDLVAHVLQEAGKFAADKIAPLNRVGDKEGTPFVNGKVVMPKGWTETYRAWAADGWNAVTGPQDWGGQGLPSMVGTACLEFWNGANMAFGVGPMLTMAAIDALEAYGSDELKRLYLGKMVSGEWMATMQLTEPQAGSDLALLRSRATPAGDSSYRLKGTKIFITYGEHDMTANIVHFVLARLPDAPPGTKGISLFLVPKFMVKADGSLGPRNDLRCASIEHKMGIHGSPTCVMNYGDNEGATGFLVGKENNGLAAMFTMMNNARLAVGAQGVGVGEAATQQAYTYAHERKQGRGQNGKDGPVAIVEHPDVKRMLLTMRALTNASRAICLKNADALDRARHGEGETERRAAGEEAALLTPVAKAFSTDAGIETSSLNIQVHGGMGFIEETGAAQLYRDSRIAAIYEGTNGIQAIDLIMRKLPLSGGATVRAYIGEIKRTVAAVNAANDLAFGATGARLGEAVVSLERTTEWLLGRPQNDPDTVLAGATPYLRLFATAAGGALLAEEALAAASLAGNDGAPARIAIARFFAENLAVQAGGLERAVLEGADSVNGADAALAG